MAQGIRKIGIVGAGQMGSGIAHVCALAGIPVVLNDIASQRMKDALATINGNMARQVSKKRITEEQKAAALKLISTVETYDGLNDCDLVIEAATEKEEVKRKIFHELCAVLKPEAIVASDTSSISTSSGEGSSRFRRRPESMRCHARGGVGERAIGRVFQVSSGMSLAMAAQASWRQQPVM